ncbi:SUI1 [Symbiodinium sp. KB8]|nr:SUI1 [Symbiodinium sp. KB8]
MQHRELKVESADADGPGGFDQDTSSGSKVHIRVQQRNGRKCITTVQGLDSDLDLKRILKAIKKRYNCNGNIKNVKEYGEIIQVQGDQRANIKEFLLGEQIYESEDRLVLHGF